jgi:hypothetical protein
MFRVDVTPSVPLGTSIFSYCLRDKHTDELGNLNSQGRGVQILRVHVSRFVGGMQL